MNNKVYELKIRDGLETVELKTGNPIVEVGGTSDYKALRNKPQINNVTLVGNKYPEDLGIFNMTNIEIEDILARAFNE